MTSGTTPAGQQTLVGDLLSDNAVITSPILWAFGAEHSDGVVFSSTPNYGYIPGAGWADTLTITSSAGVVAIYNLSAADAMVLSSLLNAGFVGLLADHLSTSSSLSYVLAAIIIQQFGVSETTQAAAIYGLALLHAVQFNSGLLDFYSGVLTDSVTATAALGVNFYPTANVSDAMQLADLFGNVVSFAFQMSDNLDFTDEELLQMLFSGDFLSDDITITAGYVSPDGNFTTWAINTRTNAVTEYQNWAFNSFAKLGSIYLGASSDGLYELRGNTDNGANIPTTITSGLMSPGGAKFTQFDGIYLSMGTADDARDILLQLTTGDGKSFTYAVRPNNMRSTKVHAGKGLRARYWAWTLSTVAADFDLEGVEFIPLIAKRRV